MIASANINGSTHRIAHNTDVKYTNMSPFHKKLYWGMQGNDV